MTPEVITAVLM